MFQIDATNLQKATSTPLPGAFRSVRSLFLRIPQNFSWESIASPPPPHTGFEEGTGAGTGPTGNLQHQCSLLPLSGISPSKQSSFLDFKSPCLLRVPKVHFGIEGCTTSFALRHGSYSWGPTHLTNLLVSKIFKSSS